MKIQFHLRGLDLRTGLRERFEHPVVGLQRLIPIAAAAVVLEYEQENTPPFRAFALLAVPGPDIHAEARDHTLEAAWLKVTAALRKQIERRVARPQVRAKTNGHLRAPPRRRTRRGALLRT